MTPAGRIAAAIDVLADIETRHRPVAEALKDWGVSHRFAGSKDRSAIGNLVYDALRWKLSSAWMMGSEAPRAIVLATVVRQWGETAATLAGKFAASPHAPEALSEDELVRLDRGDLGGAPAHVLADVPEWTAPHFARLFGEEWVAEGEALAARPPLDLRVNRLKADRDKVLKALDASGATATALAPDGVRIAPTSGGGRHPNVTVEPAFQKGWFEVQDEGSQLAARLGGAAAGEQVLDLCAGAGGKTLALAAAMENKGQVFATDADKMRLAPIFDRLKRAGARNVQIRPAGAPLTDLEGRMDMVLVDAPCTGSGVWRRRPDAKWRVTERALAERIGEQDLLLAGAVRYLKPGGRLVYVTCSLLPDEDEDRIAALLAGHADLAVLPPADVMAKAGLPALAEASLVRPEGIILTPRRTATDGFFVSVVKRS
jgi:16S rRNA (cytosine967-C5)-methyltransferase